MFSLASLAASSRRSSRWIRLSMAVTASSMPLAIRRPATIPPAVANPCRATLPTLAERVCALIASLWAMAAVRALWLASTRSFPVRSERSSVWWIRSRRYLFSSLSGGKKSLQDFPFPVWIFF